jgi:hypothetical protein
MTIGSRTRWLWLTALALTHCNGPLLILPGGALSGEVRPAPPDWSALAPFGTVQLETNPSDPYSVNIACMLVDGAPQINAGNTETKWVQNMDADPAVRLRVHGDVYELNATRVTAPSEIAAFGAEWTQQGAWARDPAKLDQVWIYRLDPR